MRRYKPIRALQDSQSLRKFLHDPAKVSSQTMKRVIVPNIPRTQETLRVPDELENIGEGDLMSSCSLLL